MSQSTSASKKSIFETSCNNGLRGAGAMVIQVSSANILFILYTPA